MLIRSMVAAAESGDATAKELVGKYHFRPEFELFDCDADPLEMTNLADKPEYKRIVDRLHGKLQDWMTAQGDLGVQTELDAIFHLRKNAEKSREEVLEAWRKKEQRAAIDR